MDILSCDVLVVGAGGAGIRAAIAACMKNPGIRVMLVSKGKFGTTGTTANSCSDRMAFHATLKHTEPGGEDAWKYHADDIYRIGGEVSDYDLAAALAKNAGDAFYYLDSIGVPFAKREDGLAHQFVTDGSRYARACYTGPRTAVHIQEALVKEIGKYDVKIVDFHVASDLIVKDGAVAGVFIVEQRTGAIRAVNCKAVVLATGGGGEVYQVHVYPGGATGDGYALAYRAGAELVNMEFIQIGLSSIKTKLACSGSLMRSIPRFINDRGEEFLPRYFQEGASLKEIYNVEFKKGASWPVSNEDESHVIDVAVFKELMQGRRVFLDYGKNPAGFTCALFDEYAVQHYQKEIKNPISSEDRDASPLMRLREINPPSIEWLKENGIDLEKGEMIEIAPSIQHFQGGVKINKKGMTTIAGLFAAGECAGGQHGANRPGGNALMDCQVFGKITGEAASEYAGFVSLSGIREETEAYREKLAAAAVRGIPAFEARDMVQRLMSRYASIVRTEEGIAKGLSFLEDLKDTGIHPDENGLAYYIETLNILDTARIVLTAQSERKESRGPHLFFASEADRVQLPRDNRKYTFYTVLKKEGDRISKERRIPSKPDTNNQRRNRNE